MPPSSPTELGFGFQPCLPVPPWDVQLRPGRGQAGLPQVPSATCRETAAEARGGPDGTLLAAGRAPVAELLQIPPTCPRAKVTFFPARAPNHVMFGLRAGHLLVPTPFLDGRRREQGRMWPVAWQQSRPAWPVPAEGSGRNAAALDLHQGPRAQPPGARPCPPSWGRPLGLGAGKCHSGHPHRHTT